MEDELLITLSSEYEANEVMAEMQSTIKEMEESEFYHNMIQQLQNGMLRDNILRVLGSDKDDDIGGSCGDRGHLQMVIYGLGSIQFHYFSQYQLSLAILLRRDFSHWFKGIIEVYDPRGTTPVDAKVMKALGCKVLININEKLHKRVVDERSPTLFFMPHIPVTVIKDLLLANWCPSRLSKMIFFSNSIHWTTNEIEKMKIRNIDDGIGDETMYDLLKTNVEHTLLEFDCDGRPCKTEEEMLYRGDIDECKWPFTHLNWHFFNFTDDVLRLEALLLPETKLAEKMRMMRDGKEEDENDSYTVQEDDHKLSSCLKFFLRQDEKLASIMDSNPYILKDWSRRLYNERYPSMPSKRIWYPPPTGWIKLNFSAVSAAVVGYGGIFHNENNECLLTYSIPLLEEEEEEDEDVVDLDFANADALRKGLRLFMDLQAKTMDKRKLVIEGDSVSIIRWVNGVFPPPKRLVEVFEEIHDLLSCIDEYAVFHIYKEANWMAIELANKGASMLW